MLTCYHKKKKITQPANQVFNAKKCYWIGYFIDHYGLYEDDHYQVFRA